MVFMKWRLRGVAAFAVAITAILAGLPQRSVAQEAPVRVEQIRLDPQAHADQIRTVRGVVDRLVSRAGAQFASFYLEDDYGHQILVVPFEAPPGRGERLTATGMVTLDAAGDPILTMLRATEMGESTEPPPVEPPPGEATPGDATPADGTEQATTSPTDVAPVAPVRPTAPPAASLFTRIRPWLIPIGAVLGFMLVSGYFYNRGRADAPRPLVTAPMVDHQDVDFATAAIWPASDQEFDGRTLRFVRPDATVRLIPGRLEVIGGGDAGEEIRFMTVQGEDGARTEMMLGRSPGEGPTHVQLKQKTVSRTHAVIRHRHGEWLIENLSTTNPTILNDEVMGVKERLLTDGDRIEMGEVIFRFRET